ncbi:MAG: peptidylprolyl isomerase [Planctomycetes bacterium]|nr:peptidylprolyl isomerase [Planctomycetota bacterium]
MSEPLPQVILHTNRGQLKLELFEDEAPNAVANFVNLIETGFYDGIKFHRVIANFMIQVGDPLTKDETMRPRWGTGGPGYCIDCEVSPGNVPHKHGAKYLSMAHAGPNTGGSQFFITHSPTPHLDGVHTVFGKVIEGIDFVDAIQQGDVIEKTEVISKREHEYIPVKNKFNR